MTDDRKLRMMQDALDGELSPEEELEFTGLLKEEPQTATRYSKMERAETLLRDAGLRHERAPERLALTIMARLGETIMLEAEQLDELDEMTEATMHIAMTMVTISTLPLMVGASWMILNARANPKAFEAILTEVAALYIMVLDVMRMMLDDVQSLYKTDPERAMATLALMPLTLLTLVRQVLGIEEDEDDE